MDDPYTMQDRQNLVALYEGRLAQFGRDARTVGWRNREDQWLRFDLLSRGLNFSNVRVLDVGCGLGDFVPFLRERGFKNYEYLGIDLAPKLIEAARSNFGDAHCKFLTVDLLNGPDIGEFDIVVSSGALSYRVHNNVDLAERMITSMFSRCKTALAINFLSNYVDYQLPKNFHYSPEAMFKLAVSLTRFVNMHHDCRLYECTMQLFRCPQLYTSPAS